VPFIILMAGDGDDGDSVQFIPINVLNERAQHSDQTRQTSLLGRSVVGCDCCRTATPRGLREVARISAPVVKM